MNSDVQLLIYRRFMTFFDWRVDLVGQLISRGG